MLAEADVRDNLIRLFNASKEEEWANDPKCWQLTANLRRVTSQKSEGLNYSAEAWKLSVLTVAALQGET